MKSRNKLTRRIAWIFAVLLAGVAFVAWSLQGGDADTSASGANLQLSPLALAGKPAYDDNCAQCHGRSGAGSDKGPPFVHAVYNPGHHSDTAFARAVAQGVRQHHWRFGDMPAQPKVEPAQLEAIVRYVRAVQVANGIRSQPHTMQP